MTRRPTVMIVSPYLPPHVGGVERYVFNTAKSLSEDHGWRVVVVATRAAQDTSLATEVLFAGLENVSLYWLTARVRWSNTPLGLGWNRRLRKIMHAENVDLVNAHAPVPFLADIAARAAGERPFVLTYHAGPLRKSGWLVNMVLWGYERQVLSGTVRRSKAVVCASPHVVKTLFGRRPTYATVIAPSVDIDTFAPGGEAVAGRVLFVGSLNESTAYKGLDFLLEAIAQLRDDGREATLVVVGDGDDRARYEARAADLGIAPAVRFLGARSGSELVEAYRSADVLALPSTFDNYPTVLLEAMACGTPVVASDIGSVSQMLLGGELGQLVPPGRVDVLARELSAILDDPGPARARARRALQHVRSRRSAVEQGRRTASVFADVLGRERGDVRRVAVVAPRFPPQIGGVENYACHIVDHLARTPGWQPVVVSTNDGWRTRLDASGETLVVRLGTWLRISNTTFNPLWGLSFRRLYRRLDIDVVNAHSPVPLFADAAVRAAGSRPVVLTYHSGSLQKGSAAIDMLLRAYERWVLPRVFRRCAELVAVSPVAMTHATGRATVITPGVDVAVFSPPPAGSERGCSLLYVGRVERTSMWKGLDVLINALPVIAARMPDVVLDIVGSGDAEVPLRELADSLGVEDRIRWHGATSHEGTVEYYRDAGVLVLPSLTESESFGMSLVEAMACGCPVIGSAVGGIPMVVRDEIDGLLVPPGDVDALARAALRVLGDPTAGAAMGKAGREAAEGLWDWDLKTDQMVELLDRASSRTDRA